MPGPFTEDFYSVTLPDLRAPFVRRGAAAVHGDNLFRHIYKFGATGPHGAQGLGPRLENEQAETFSFALPSIGIAQQSGYDHSVKFRMDLADGARVETVLMPER